MNQPTPTARPTSRADAKLALTCDNSSLSPRTVEPIPARLGGGRIQSLRARLSDRDLSVLHSLSRLRLMTGAQLQRLHVADGSAVTQGPPGTGAAATAE